MDDRADDPVPFLEFEVFEQSGGAETGLAFRILEAGYRLAIPRLFAALFLLSLTGIVIYLLLDWLSRRVLQHWHESASQAEDE